MRNLPKDYIARLKEFEKLCNDGLTINEISERLGVTTRTVENYCNTLSLKPARKIKRNKSLDVDYFEKIETEGQAYVLGFISADGYIDVGERSVCIAINKRDIDIIEKIKCELNSNAEFHDVKTPNCVRINFCSRKLVADIKKFGVCRNKSKTIRLPTLSEGLYRHFLRGYFDGNGHVGKRQVVLCTGSELFRNDVADFLSKKFSLPISVKKQGAAYYIVLSRKDLDIVSWIYSDSKIYLNRKYNSYIDNWVSYAERRRSEG